VLLNNLVIVLISGPKKVKVVHFLFCVFFLEGSKMPLNINCFVIVLRQILIKKFIYLTQQDASIEN
jgi:hypothetical protein